MSGKADGGWCETHGGYLGSRCGPCGQSGGLRELAAQATPGPWTLGYEDGSGRGENEDGIYVRAEEQELADNQTVVRGGFDDWGIAHGVIRDADARLVALAPEMAALLADTAEHLEWLRGYAKKNLPHGLHTSKSDALLARYAALNQKAAQ